MFTGGAAEVFLQDYSKYLEAAAALGSFILGNLPTESNEDNAKSDFEVLSNLSSKVLSGVRETELGNDESFLGRRTNIGFGIWDLPQKSSTKAKFGTLGLNWDLFGTIFIPFWDF